MIDEKYALKMIHLMLQAGGQHPTGLYLHPLAVEVEKFGADAGRSLHIVPDFRHGQTTFLESSQLVGGPKDLGIYEDPPILLAVLLVQVQHDHPFGDANLNRGQADAIGGIHAIGHVFGQLANGAIHFLDVGGDGFEPWIGRDKDRTDCHGREIGEAKGRVKKRMEFAIIVLGVALVAAAAILAYARPKPAPEPSRPDPRLDELIRGQGMLTGRFEQTVAAQNQLSSRLDDLNKRLGDSLKENTDRTAETLGSIQTRLNVIDAAQKNIHELSGHVVSLKAIFSDKQARGAVSQDQMEAIVAEHLAPDQYEFQATLSNNSRPDCAIRIPNVKARIVVDSKFPLESFEALRKAENEDVRKAAMVQVRNDVQKHVKDIAEKYLIPGEVQTPAIMFVPSDSMYAELHANFPETLRRARQMQVVIVSPHVFMLVIGTIQGLMRDAKMREQAHAIQIAVGALLQDARRLGERVGKLRDHFETTSKDIGQIEISMRAIERHADRIGQVDLVDRAEALERIEAPKERGGP